MPKVSVLMPVYNTEEGYLREAIESILNQTYTDFEFLIIDDKSTNNAPDVIAEYAKNDKRIKVIQGLHKGIGFVRNLGIKEAQGEYIAWLDSDDISLPERLEKQVSYLEKNKDITICCTAFKIIPSNKIVVPPQKITILDLYEDNCICQSSVMIRSEDVEKFGLWYKEDMVPEDYDLWARAVKKVNIAALSDILVHYNTIEGSLSKRKQRELHEGDAKIRQQLIDYVTLDERLQKQIKNIVYLKKLKKLQKVFSIRSRYVNGQKQKVLVLLGHCYPLLIKNSIIGK